MATLEQIKELREMTGVSIAKCKEALESSNNDIAQAKELLRKWGQAVADKKQDRTAGVGIIEGYVHSNRKIGVLLDIRCETDFAANSGDFRALAHDLTLHIAAMNPPYISEEDIPAEVAAKEKEIYREEVSKSGKPKEIIEKMIEGKWKKFKEENCLLEQKFVKDDSMTIKEYISQYVQKIGEKIVVNKFVRIDI
ncbi:MAG TPA: elongation factor Ts [Candidatus Pacearchaeota archaeon]|nr:elongation factor Ts [Candidatus Pacearchaeota archaeon]